MSRESIAVRVAAATPGPWEAGPQVEGLYDFNGIPVTQVSGGYVAADISDTGDNAAFIAHARQDIPALLAVSDAAAAIVSEPIPDDEGGCIACGRSLYSVRHGFDKHDPDCYWDVLRSALAALEALP